jgi:hypothetical protein
MGIAPIELLFIENTREANNRVQFVYRAVRLDARRVFRNPLAAHQGGLAAISRARINTRNSNHHILAGSGLDAAR